MRAKHVQSRHEARLACLSRAEPPKIAASGMHKSEDTRRLGDAILAERAPVPEWAVEGVLTSVDLLRPLLASLAIEDCYTGLVCTTWRAAWTNRMKHMLRLCHQSISLFLVDQLHGKSSRSKV